jgi:hypothetical protein
MTIIDQAERDFLPSTLIEWVLALIAFCAAGIVGLAGDERLGVYMLGSRHITLDMLRWFWIGLLLLIGMWQLCAAAICSRQCGSAEGICAACPRFRLGCRINRMRRLSFLVGAIGWLALTFTLFAGDLLVSACFAALLTLLEFCVFAVLPASRWNILST